MFNGSTDTFPLITAHSGAEGTKPNSIEFVRVAAEAGADCVELDLRITRDGIPIFMHDPSVANSADELLFVADASYSLLNKTIGGKLPRAVDVLMAVHEADVSVNLDIKDARALESVSGFLRDTGLSDRTILSGFHLDQVVNIRNNFPEFTCMLNIDTELDEGTLAEDSEDVFDRYLEGAVRLGCPVVNLEHVYCDRERVELAHRKGLKVSVWTPDNEELFRRFLDMKVDFITTNKVSKLRKLVK